MCDFACKLDEQTNTIEPDIVTTVEISVKLKIYN